MMDYFLLPKFGKPSMKELKIMEDNIQAPWNIHTPLQENIDKMSKTSKKSSMSKEDESGTSV
jgi:hypothetical protein